MSDFESIEEELKFMADISDNQGDDECQTMFIRYLGHFRKMTSDYDTLAQQLAARDKRLEEVTQLLREVANYTRHHDYDWYIEDINAVDAIINTTSTEGKDHD